MRIIIDSNRVIASLIKNSTTREILFDNHVQFFAPSYIKTEIYKYKDSIIKKTKLSNSDFDILLELLFENVTIIPNIKYQQHLSELNKEIKDKKDLPYLAAALLINAEGIWTHDPHFKSQKKCKVMTNIDMLEIIRKIKK